MENAGDATCNPMRLSDKVLWHIRHITFQLCPCITSRTSKHYDPVQTLFLWKFRTMLQKKAQVDLIDGGAVIFGYNTNLHWHWKDNGDPVKGDPPQDAAIDAAFPSDDADNNSGLGS